jgi:hypothetical protein
MKKIPKYCFKCGVIRHGTKGCVRIGGQRANRREEELKFGSWLRVPSLTRRWGMSGGWNQGGRWGRTQLERMYEGDQRRQEWRNRAGNSARSSIAPAKEGSNYGSRISSLSLSKKDSGNNGVAMENNEVLMGGEDTTLPVMGRFYGDRISNTIEGDVVDNLNKGKISNEVNHSNGKNIYVG